MEAGKRSPIVGAIADAERLTTGEIRVHLSRSWLERDAFLRAQKLFREFGMARTPQHDSILLYLNLRSRRFAIIADEGIHQAVGQQYWERLARHLREDLLSTHPENAVAMAVRTLGITLQKYYPASLDKYPIQ